jgi:translation initiation factor 2B subunit (eIF-2B alpha/beta/delta family)
MNKDLREDIQNAREHLFKMSNSALSVERIIKVAEQVLSAGEELPEKKESTANCMDCLEDTAKGFNEALSLCLPIHAKLKAQFTQKEKDLDGIVKYLGSQVYDRDKEISKLKSRVAELEEALSAYREAK